MRAAETWARLLIGHRLDLLRAEAGTIAEMTRAYQQALGDIERAIERAAERPTDARAMERLRGLAGELDARIREAEQALAKRLEVRAQEAADAERALSRRRLAPVVAGTGVAWTVPPDRAIDRAWGVPLRVGLLDTTQQLRSALARGLARGASAAEVARMARDAGAAIEGGQQRLVMIARTEIQRAANDAALETYRLNSDVLSGVLWLATLDSRTCLRCAPLHGQTYTLDKAPPCPLHPRCRCFLAPVPKTAAEMGLAPKQQRLFDGRPPAALDFGAWLRRQPTDRQVEFFGSDARRAMWLGGAPLSKFSDAAGVLPLGELRRRAGETATNADNQR